MCVPMEKGLSSLTTMKRILFGLAVAVVGFSVVPHAFALTDAEILASSTALVANGVVVLVNAVFAFLPIILGVAIPLGMLYAAYRWVTRRGRVR